MKYLSMKSGFLSPEFVIPGGGYALLGELAK